MTTTYGREGRRILVTGGRGFLGKHLVKALVGSGEDVRAPTSLEMDLCDYDDVLDYMRDVQPDVVFHLAARVGGIGANRKHPGEFFRDNMLMGMNLLEAVAYKDHPSRRIKVIIVGTVCAYPRVPPHIPFREADLWEGFPEETNAPYGIAKKALMVMGQAYRQQYGMNIIHVIPTNLYGPGDNFDPASSHVIPAIIRTIHEAKREGRETITLWGNGTPTRDFLHVEDAVGGIIAAGKHYDDSAPVNLGTGEEVTISHLAEVIAWHMKWYGKIEWDVNMPNGQPRRCLDVSRAAELFGWRATWPLVEGLKQTIAWYEKTQ